MGDEDSKACDRCFRFTRPLHVVYHQPNLGAGYVSEGGEPPQAPEPMASRWCEACIDLEESRRHVLRRQVAEGA